MRQVCMKLHPDGSWDVSTQFGQYQSAQVSAKHPNASSHITLLGCRTWASSHDVYYFHEPYTYSVKAIQKRYYIGVSA
jgi:hypothetical protein